VKEAKSIEDEVVLAERAFSEDELGLTKKLIESLTMEGFDLGRYKDSYVENLKELIEAKVEGREIFTAPIPEESGVLNLIDALKESVAKARENPGGKLEAQKRDGKPADKKMARSTRKGPWAKRKRKCG